MLFGVCTFFGFKRGFLARKGEGLFNIECAFGAN